MGPRGSQSRGTQRLISVEYFFSEKQILTRILLLEDSYTIQDDRSIHLKFSKLI